MSEDGPLWPAGIERILLDETDSTMAEAARRAPPAVPVWIMARRQMSGRGRQGRGWASPEGNFAATFLTPTDRPTREVALTSFQAALALYDTLALWVARERLALKWPNDVLLDGGKVAGILLETSGQGERVDWLAVGIGINLVAAPDPTTLPEDALPPVVLTTRLDGPLGPLGAPPPDAVLKHLAFHMALMEGLWRTAGFDALRQLWLARAARLGEMIRARCARETVIGRFETIDSDGCLVLGTEAGARRIAAADVFFA